MAYWYLIVLGCYLLLFVLSRREKVSMYLASAERKTYPGEVFFLKAAEWCIRQQERLSVQSGRRGRAYQDSFYKKQLGNHLKLLHPELPEKQQVKEFRVRQCSRVLLIIFAGNLLSFCVAFSGKSAQILQEGNYINRKAHGQGNIEVVLSAQVEEEEPEEIPYTVAAQKYTEEEINGLYKEASAALAKRILGNNSGLDNVTEDLELSASIEEYPFQITWDSSQYSLVHTDGQISNEMLEEPQIVMLTAHFQYEGMEYEETFPVQVQPAVYTEKELSIKELMDSLAERDQASETESVMRLPENIGTKKVVWKEVVQDGSGYFFLLTCIAALLTFFMANKEIEESLEKRKKELLLDYPEIVNKLVLYMGAGMTIRNAFLKMGGDYKKQEISSRKCCIYEEILLLCRELQSGISEAEAYAHLGKRCQLQHYMKLCALLSQNIRKGGNDLLMMLRQEAVNAFEERKNTAKKLGEEAGTKLLVPMMMMLCIVMALIMVPAFLSFG